MTPRNPPWKGHAALPDVEDLDRIMQVLGQLVEQHVAETPAEHNSDHAIKQQVVEILVSSNPGPDAA
jgi:hypothetical protein